MTYPKNFHRRLLIAIVGIAFAAFVLGIWLQQKEVKKSHAPVKLQGGTMLSAGMPLSPFKLINDNGKPLTQKNLRGKWTLVFFGFTNCPKVCPTTLAELNQVYQQLQNDKIKKMPRVLFVSVDPARDKPSIIRAYLAHFNKHFEGATGNKKQLNSLTKEVGIAFMKAQKSNDKNYNIEHSGAILVLNPQGIWVAVLTAPHNSKTMVKDYLQIVRRI